MTLKQAIKKATHITATAFIAGDSVYLKTTRVEALRQLDGLLDTESNSDGQFDSEYGESIGWYDADNNELILGS